MCSSVSTSLLSCTHAVTNAVAESTTSRVSAATEALEEGEKGALSGSALNHSRHIAPHLVSLYSSRCCLVHSVERPRDSRRDANKPVTLSARW